MSSKGKPTPRSRAWKTKAARSRNGGMQVGRIQIPNEPPSITPSPWMPLTVARIMTWGKAPILSGLIQSLDIGQWIAEQLDPSKKYFPYVAGVLNREIPIYFKIESVAVWNLTGKTIALGVNDFTTNDVNQYTVTEEDYEMLGSWFDSGSGMVPPKIGYRWPSSNRNKILSNHVVTTTSYGEGLRHLFTVLAPSGDQIMLHVRLFWRFPATGKEMLANIAGIFHLSKAVENMALSGEVASAEFIRLQKRLANKQDKIYNAMPNKILGAVPVLVENKILPTEEVHAATYESCSNSSCSVIEHDELHDC